MGGKQSLAARIVPYFAASSEFVEPFVGMGSVYLGLRSAGFSGKAILADSNPSVADFWRIVHDRERAAELLALAEAYVDLPQTEAVFREFAGSSIDDPLERIVRFLWLCNIAYANVPPVYLPDEKRWRIKGTKMTSAAKFGHKFSWSRCVERLKQVIQRVAGRPVIVCSSAAEALSEARDEAAVYADPPYVSTEGYGVHLTEHGWVPFLLLVLARFRVAAISETHAVETMDGWRRIELSRPDRVTHKGGTKPRRTEYLYLRGAVE